MGKELSYNYFTAEDVKHLIEDEAFDIRSKFTELLGNGEWFYDAMFVCFFFK